MNWVELCGILAAVYQTPLPMIWTMTMRQIAAYASQVPDVLPIHNPFVSQPEKPITDPQAIEAVARAFGVPVKEPHGPYR